MIDATSGYGQESDGFQASWEEMMEMERANERYGSKSDFGFDRSRSGSALMLSSSKMFWSGG